MNKYSITSSVWWVAGSFSIFSHALNCEHRVFNSDICRIIPVLVEHKISQYLDNSLIQTKVVYFPISKSLCYMFAAIILCVQLDVVDIFSKSKIIVFHIDHLLLSHWVSYFRSITITSATTLSHDFNKHPVELRSRSSHDTMIHKNSNKFKWFAQFRTVSLNIVAKPLGWDMLFMLFSMTLIVQINEVWMPWK